MSNYEMSSDGTTAMLRVWPLKYLAEVLGVDKNVITAFATVWDETTGPAWVCLGGAELYFDPKDVESWLRERADCVAHSLKNPDDVLLRKEQVEAAQEVNQK